MPFQKIDLFRRSLIRFSLAKCSKFLIGIESKQREVTPVLFLE